MKEIIQYFRMGADFQNVMTAFENEIKEQLVAGLSGSARTLFLSALYQALNRPQLIVTHNLHQAQKLYDDLIEYVGEEPVAIYPVNELISSEIATASPEMRGQRIRVLNELILGHKTIIIVPLAGMRRMLPPIARWQASQMTFNVEQEINLEDVQQRLVSLGYERVEMIESQGEYSIRGGIIDIFPASAQKPVRVVLFDTEVESIRFFDISTQRSDEEIKTITIGPTVEWIFEPQDFNRAQTTIEAALDKQLKKSRDQAHQALLKQNIGWELEQLREAQLFLGVNKYISAFYQKPGHILNYMPKDTIVICDEPARIQEAEESYKKEELEWQSSLIQAGEYVNDIPFSFSLEEWKERSKHAILCLSLFLRQVPFVKPQNIVNFTCKSMQSFHGQLPILKTEIERWKKSKQVIIFLASNEERAKRMARVLDDFEIEHQLQIKERRLTGGTPLVQIGHIQGGYELPLHSLVVVTESEVFSKQQKRTKTRNTSKSMSNAERIKNYSELGLGDYVVHINHGIGRYMGIKTLEIGGIHKDYLHLKYSGNDMLYVPVDQIAQVQKYIGSEEKDPKLYSLSGSEWKKVKSKVQSSVKDIADDLIKLYAQRQSTPGYAFSKDTDMHSEFDALFLYQETEDQLRAIQEIKADMEQDQPMDRLLCGDVGYGKTEVAIRAAFKSVMDGKQVAILVPTTILAQQHFETFRERFHDYPVRIDVMSRFRSKKEQNQTIKNLKSGVTDIVIGTHRILSKDIIFEDLGLLIVDEEQRFGVSHKEKIKQLKTNIDVLTLTATPIPRTLHMSMLGVRDLSVIETPPENRFPVQTYVLEYNGALVREAIERELARGGQVYFLYNQVEGIERMAEQIKVLVPDARVAIAHGQMKETELEAVMIDFLEGQFDVLVSTTIIETGVDIPNVNTLIIYNADKMGLSQLYQLRGRVGRSNRVAYAYFTYQRDKVLSEVAEKRLHAIKEFTELGSGFKIAMRDLSIRGAGNLLGAEQHGFIASVGFDLYSQMLKDAIEERKGTVTQEEKFQVEIDLPIDAYIPEAYIFDGRQKIEMYKKVAAIGDMETAQEVYQEFHDRFGPLPTPAAHLMLVARLKVYAAKLGIESIMLKNDSIKMMFHTSQNDKIDGGRLFHLVSQLDRRFGLSSGQQIGITCRIKGLEEDTWLSMLEQLFIQLEQGHIKKGEEKKHAL